MVHTGEIPRKFFIALFLWPDGPKKWPGLQRYLQHALSEYNYFYKYLT